MISLENPNNLYIIITTNKSVYQGARFKVNVQRSDIIIIVGLSFASEC